MSIVKELRGYVLRVSDLESALRLYRDGLGLEVAHAAGSTMVQLTIPGGSWIELGLSDQLEKRPIPTDRRQALESIVFVVDDLEAAIDHLVSYGARVVNQLVQISSARIGYLADSDGHVFGLAQPI